MTIITDHHVSKKVLNVELTYYNQIHQIYFDEEKSITWYFVDGTVKKITPFSYIPKRNIGDQFMNVNNDIATTLLACNNNLVLGDRACFFYVTLYSTKHNQKEESCTYHSICLALSKRIKNQQEVIASEDTTTEHTEEIAPDFCEGLKRMLSALYAHTAKNVLSSTMSWKILYEGSRFKFSHQTETIPLPHLIEWADGNDNLDFRLKK